MPCYLRPLSPISAEPAGVPIPQGWWISASSPLFTCTAVSGSFRRPKAEGFRGFHNLDGSRFNGVSLRHSCGEALWTSWSSNAAQKRGFDRARNRVAQAGPDGHTWYRGRRCCAADLGLLRSRSSIIAPLHSTRARRIAKRTSLPCLHLPAWPPAGDTPSTFAAFRQRGLLSVLSLNLGGLTQHGYDELCTWLHTPAVRDQVDIICLQETWRLGSEYLLPDWFWFPLALLLSPDRALRCW